MVMVLAGSPARFRRAPAAPALVKGGGRLMGQKGSSI